MTTLDFKFYDVCPYYILSDTDLPFNTNVQVSVDYIANSDVFLLTGTSFDSVYTQVRVTQGQTVTFSSKEGGILIVKSIFENPFVQFSFSNVQVLSNAEYVGIIIGASVGYFIILLLLVIFISRCMIRNSLRKLQSPNIVYFLKKKVL